jgi:hypothetical protein
MRFAGPAMFTDPASIPKISDRKAGEVAKKNPALVERITNAIMIGPESLKPHGGQPSA